LITFIFTTIFIIDTDRTVPVKDNKFIISLELKNSKDRLILAKGYDITSPKDIVNKLGEIDFDDYEHVKEEDLFEMPELHLDYHRDYEEMVGKALGNEAFCGYIITTMFENIKFDMDHIGARVENEAVVLAEFGYANKPKPKRLILDNPFWVIMKQNNSTHPYFMLGVDNTELMIKE